MAKTSNGLGMAASVMAMAGLVVPASAGPNCNPGGARYSAPKVAVAKPAPAPRVALASKPAPVKPVKVAAASPAPIQSGGEGTAPVVLEKIEKVETPAVQQQAAVPAPVVKADAEPDYNTSVSGIAARLAAMSSSSKRRTTPVE